MYFSLYRLEIKFHLLRWFTQNFPVSTGRMNSRLLMRAFPSIFFSLPNNATLYYAQFCCFILLSLQNPGQ